MLNYDVRIVRDFVDNEMVYTAHSIELGFYTCYGTGRTPVQALKSYIKEEKEFLDFLKQRGEKIPERQPTEFKLG